MDRTTTPNCSAILGIDVIVERTGTVFEDVSFDSLAIDDVLEVSGFPETGNNLRATRVEKKSAFVPGETEIEVKGVVANLSPSQFNLGEFTVDYSNADLSEVSGGSLTDGMSVEVYGTLNGQLITASRLEDEGGIADLVDDDDDFSVQGPISSFVSSSNFKVSGVTVNAGNARLTPSGLTLANGVIVEAEGTWNGSVLAAESIEARRGRVEIEATVSSVEPGSVTLALFNGTVTVQVDSRTLLDDDTDQVDKLTLLDIGSGDFLEVEAILSAGELIATRIDRDEQDDDVLQGPVDSFNPGVEITLTGSYVQRVRHRVRRPERQHD